MRDTVVDEMVIKKNSQLISRTFATKKICDDV